MFFKGVVINITYILRLISLYKYFLKDNIYVCIYVDIFYV